MDAGSYLVKYLYVQFNKIRQLLAEHFSESCSRRQWLLWWWIGYCRVCRFQIQNVRNSSKFAYLLFDVSWEMAQRNECWWMAAEMLAGNVEFRTTFDRLCFAQELLHSCEDVRQRC